MARKSVAALPSAGEQRWQVLRTTRPCKRCGKQFWPVRRDQLFCPGGDCRRAWWREHRKTEKHNCRCGKSCGPRKPRPRRKECEYAKRLKREAKASVEHRLANHRKYCPGCSKEAR